MERVKIEHVGSFGNESFFQVRDERQYTIVVRAMAVEYHRTPYGRYTVRLWTGSRWVRLVRIAADELPPGPDPMTKVVRIAHDLITVL